MGTSNSFSRGAWDGYWAQHLATSVGGGDCTRANIRSASNLSKAAYISSAGISVLVQMYQQFCRGTRVVLRLRKPSAPVKKVLELVGLSKDARRGKRRAARARGAATAVVAETCLRTPASLGARPFEMQPTCVTPR